MRFTSPLNVLSQRSELDTSSVADAQSVRELTEAELDQLYGGHSCHYNHKKHKKHHECHEYYYDYCDCYDYYDYCHYYYYYY